LKKADGNEILENNSFLPLTFSAASSGMLGLGWASVASGRLLSAVWLETTQASSISLPSAFSTEITVEVLEKLSLKKQMAPVRKLYCF
jgi:hypothetical protein